MSFFMVVLISGSDTSRSSLWEMASCTCYRFSITVPLYSSSFTTCLVAVALTYRSCEKCSFLQKSAGFVRYCLTKRLIKLFVIRNCSAMSCWGRRSVRYALTTLS